MINVEEIRKKAAEWLSDEFNEKTRKEVKALLENNSCYLIIANPHETLRKGKQKGYV